MILRIVIAALLLGGCQTPKKPQQRPCVFASCEDPCIRLNCRKHPRGPDMAREIKAGDHTPVSDEENAFNKRNGLPRFKYQEVLAVLKPGEVGADYGFHGPIYGYLNYGEHRLLVGNSVGSRDGKFFFWPLKHEEVA